MLAYWFIQIILCVILTELLTELLVKSEIFKPVRRFVFKAGGWVKQLLSCGYCTSVWMAFGVVILTKTTYPLTGSTFLDWALMALVIHRLSNILHNVIDKWTDKYYDSRFVNSVKNED